VLGFLGHWAAQADNFVDREQHMLHRPSIGQVEAYLKGKGWLQ
jgi:hypothetical protein